MKFAIIIGEDEDTGALLTSPMGGTITWTDPVKCCEVARKIASGPLRQQHPTWNVFAVKLQTMALYIPYKHPTEDGATLVDETVLDTKVFDAKPLEGN